MSDRNSCLDADGERAKASVVKGEKETSPIKNGKQEVRKNLLKLKWKIERFRFVDTQNECNDKDGWTDETTEPNSAEQARKFPLQLNYCARIDLSTCSGACAQRNQTRSCICGSWPSRRTAEAAATVRRPAPWFVRKYQPKLQCNLNARRMRPQQSLTKYQWPCKMIVANSSD